MRSRKWVSIAVLGTTLAVSGCGGSSGDGSKSLTSAELVAKANPVCARITAKIAYYSNLKPANSKDLVSASAIASAAPQIAAVERAAQADLAKLTPPTAMAGDWKLMVADIGKIAQYTAQLGELATAKNPRSSGAGAVLAAAAKTVQHMHAIAGKGGLTECAKVA